MKSQNTKIAIDGEYTDGEQTVIVTSIDMGYVFYDVIYPTTFQLRGECSHENFLKMYRRKR